MSCKTLYFPFEERNEPSITIVGESIHTEVGKIHCVHHGIIITTRRHMYHIVVAKEGLFLGGKRIGLLFGDTVVIPNRLGERTLP